MTISNETVRILAMSSVRDGEQRYTEDQIRSMVGAPSREEDEVCLCGDKLTECNDSYAHMTSGV